MKKILLSLMIIAVIGFTAKVQAQCDLEISNTVVQINTVTPYPDVNTGPNCKAVVNVSFDINTNSGFKYLFFHSWRAQDYPNPAIFDCSGQSPAVDPGTATQLGTAVDQTGKSFLDFGFVGLKDFIATNPTYPADVTAFIATTYLHDNSVVLTQPANSPGLKAILTKTGNVLHFDVTDLTVIVNQACNATLSVKTDIWGSNSNAPDPKAQCYLCGIQQFFNDPAIAGFKNCNTPNRQYTLGLTTVDPTPKDITYKIYVDMNSNGTLEPLIDELAFTSGTISISAATPFSTGGPVSLASPYSDTQPYSENGYLILVEGLTLSNSVSKFFPQPQGCIGLPVSFSSFTATRNKSNVMVKWETSSEINNSGFAVERNINGTWEQVAFVPSQALNGNSDQLLSYQYIDFNTAKGITQYRIRQIDIDQKTKYTEIRSVKGDGQIGKVIIYPNPTANGRVNVVFDDASVVRDVNVIDMSGRTIRSFRGISNNNITIDNLTPGIYSLRIFVPETGEQTVEKVVVNQR